MQDDERLTPIEAELEAALLGLKPAGGAANRDCVMFLAGQASMRRRNRLWQGAAALLVVALVASLTVRPEPEGQLPRRDLVANGGNQIAPVYAAAGEADNVDAAQVEAYRQYVRLRRWVLQRGVDALPGSTVSPARENDSSTARRQLEELLSST